LWVEIDSKGKKYYNQRIEKRNAMQVNKKYKDSVFTLLFGEKQTLIELYNAASGTNYTMDTDVEINTL